MASPVVIKAVAGSGLVGATVGGGFLIKSLISKKELKKTLSNKLEKDKFTLLNLDVSKEETSDSKWQTILTNYVSLTSKNSELKIDKLTLKSAENQGEEINKLKNACSSLLKTTEDSKDFKKNYQLASKWCVEPVSIEILLKARGITYLDTTGQTNEAEWTNTAKRYEVDHKTNKNTIMNGVDWTQVSDGNYSENSRKIKTACNSRKTKNSYEENFERSLEEAQWWCVATPKENKS